MSVISLILLLAVLGLCLYLLLKFIPMPAPLPQIIIALVVLGVILWVLNATGIYTQHWLHL